MALSSRYKSLRPTTPPRHASSSRSFSYPDTPVPILTPFLPPRPARARPRLGKLYIDPGMVGLPRFQQITDPTEDVRTPQMMNAAGKAGNTNDSLDNAMNEPERKEFSDDNIEELELLGEGNGGAVHKVRDKRDGEIYARKTITTSEVPMKQVFRELNILKNMTHSNIVRYFGGYVDPAGSGVKMIMEYCDASSLEAIGKKIKGNEGVVDEKIAGRLAEGILQGLSYLHLHKIIHGDIKPPNILLSRDGTIKLCDFGVSGELVESSIGTFAGTLVYMAPEKISGGNYTIRSDVWSMGISLLELVQNRFPFTFPTDAPAFEILLMIRDGQPPRLEDAPETGIIWSREMKYFIGQALAVDPTMRPIPAVLLMDRWINSMMEEEVDMARWICQVWGWSRTLPPRSLRQ